MPEARVYPSIPKKILVPLDFSPSSQVAMDVAADLAQHFHATLHLVNIIPFVPTTTMPDFVPEASFIADARWSADRHMASCHKALALKGVMSDSTVEVGNDTAVNIMEIIERERVDMVIISTHGISGWRPFLFGSIAEKVVKLVQCPLLLLRSTEHQSAANDAPDTSSEWWPAQSG